MAFTADVAEVTALGASPAVTAVQNAVAGSSATLDGGQGRDIVQAGSGGDTLIFDATDYSILGSYGSDTLVIADTSVDLRASNTNVPVLSSIETFQLNQTAVQKVWLDQEAVYRIGGSNHTLTVLAGSEDAILVRDVAGATGNGLWTYNSATNTYTCSYTPAGGSAVTLTVQVNVAENDTLAVSDAGVDFTSNTSMPSITGIETIDLHYTGYGAGVGNSITLNAQSVAAMKSATACCSQGPGHPLTPSTVRPHLPQLTTRKPSRFGWTASSAAMH